MTESVNEPARRLDISNLNPVEKGALHAGIRLYARELEKEANACEKLGQMYEAGRLHGIVGGLREEVIEPGPGGMDLFAHHIVPIRKGLELLEHVARSSKGINTSIDEPESVERSEAKADLVKNRLIPMFAEQPELPGLAGANGGDDE